MGGGWMYESLNRAFRLMMGTPTPQLLSLGKSRYEGLAGGAWGAGACRGGGLTPTSQLILSGKPKAGGCNGWWVKWVMVDV
jgi:hypothetical protein